MHKDLNPVTELNKLEVAKKCLRMISDIATRAADSNDAEHISYAIQELSQVLFERTGSEERLYL